MVKKFGFSKIAERRDCLNWFWNLNRYCTRRRCMTVSDCQAAALKAGAKYFIFGRRRFGRRSRARCVAHKKNDGKCAAKKRPWMRKKGWIKGRHSVFKITTKLVAASSKKKLLVNTDTKKIAAPADAKKAAEVEVDNTDPEKAVMFVNNDQEYDVEENMSDAEIAAAEKEEDDAKLENALELSADELKTELAAEEEDADGFSKEQIEDAAGEELEGDEDDEDDDDDEDDEEEDDF